MKKSIKIALFLTMLIFLGTLNLTNAAVRSVGYDSGSPNVTEKKSCWQQGYRLISCSTGQTCTTCTDELNGKKYYKKSICVTTGYINSCPAGTGQILDTTKKLECDGSYSKSCICGSEYQYGPGREICDNTLGIDTCTIGGKTYSKTCECGFEYSETCEKDVEIPMTPSDSCGGKYKVCKCIKDTVSPAEMCDNKVVNGKTCYVNCKDAPSKTCETEGFITSCGTDKIGTAVTADEGKLSCQKDCRNKTCADGGFLDSVPTNKKCTVVTYAGKTCQKNCIALTCADGGFLDSVPTNKKCTAVTYAGKTCQKSCIALTCADGGFVDSAPMNKICETVSYSGLTCQKNCNRTATCEDFDYYSSIPIRMKSCNNITPYNTTLTCYNKCVWKPEYQCNKDRCRNICGTSKCVGSIVGNGICSMVQDGGCSKIQNGACSMIQDGGLSMIQDGGCSMIQNGGCSMIQDGGCSMVGNRDNKCPSSC